MPPKTLTPTHETVPDWFITEGHWMSEAMRDFLRQGEALARRYVAAIDRDPSFHEFMAVQYPDIPAPYWRRLERVGRGQLDLRILIGNAPYGNKLERLSASEQKRALDGQLPLLLSNGDVLHVSISNIRPRQADQLFAFDHVRDLAAQRTFLEDQRLEDEKKGKHTTSVVVEVDGDDFLVDGKTVERKKLASYIKTLLGN